jgi:hypothetical protein
MVLTLSQFRKSNNAINAVFAILSAIGFSSAMGACFFLNKETSLQNDLWCVLCLVGMLMLANHKQEMVLR